MKLDWLQNSRLWLVTDKQVCEPDTVANVVAKVISCGIDIVVFRDKASTAVERGRAAAQVQSHCLDTNTPFVVAHDLELASRLNAQALHLGQADQSIARTRETVGDSMAIGYSSHSVREASEAFEQGADYVFLGPIFASPQKLKFGQPLGTGVITSALALKGPVVFIGGMDENTIPKAIVQGATRFAAIRSFQQGQNPTKRVESIARLAAQREV